MEKHKIQPKRPEVKLKARLLYLEKGFDQKRIAEELGVSENTISKWSKDQNWKALSEQKVTNEFGANIFFGGFHSYVQSTAPHILQQLNRLYQDYLFSTDSKR